VTSAHQVDRFRDPFYFPLIFWEPAVRIKTISAGGYDASTQVLTLQGKTPSGGDISVKIELDDVAQFAEIFASLALRSGATPALIASELYIEIRGDDDCSTLLCNFALKTGSAFRVAVPLQGLSENQVDKIKAHLEGIARLLGAVTDTSVH
jgi:hypothetical protein